MKWMMQGRTMAVAAAVGLAAAGGVGYWLADAKEEVAEPGNGEVTLAGAATDDAHPHAAKLKNSLPRFPSRCLKSNRFFRNG